MSKILLGSHVSYKSNDYLVGSVNEALSYGANCFMIYTGPPQNTIRKKIDINIKNDAFELMKKNNINFLDVIVHAPYIINMASPNEDTYNLAKDFLIEEIKRTHELGFKYLVLHPGSRLSLTIDEGIKRIYDGLNYVLQKTKEYDVIICLETMAGKGSEVGSKFKEIKEIIDNINFKSRIGVCLDTCHIWESGIDINDVDYVIDKFDKIIGLDFLKVIHLNASKNEIGAHKDRHENIGYGPIPFDTILSWVYSKKLENIPKILETPYYDKDGKFISPYGHEIKMIKEKKWYDFKNK